MEGEDMDSLFEGMVLFNPDQIEPDNQEKNDSEDDCVQNGKSDAGTSAVTTGSCSGSQSQSQSQSQPLDENLFSDLTLVVDPLQNLEVGEAEHDLQTQSWQQQQQQQQPSTSTITSSRQSFRRRKRSGLKIGYGRDTVDLSQSQSQSPHISETPPSLPVDSISTGDTDVAVTQPSTTTTTSSSESSITITTDVAVSQSEIENERHEKEDDETCSSEAEFRQIKATIHDKLKHARQLVNSASAVRKDAIRSRRKTVEDANLASLKYMELEKQLEEACEAEDFDRAEKVSEHLSAAEKEKQILANSLRQADALIDALDLKLQHALHSHILAEEECAILLDHYATNALNNADSSLKKATSVYSREMNQWLSSSEALEVKKIELEIESHFISEAHFELNNTIERSIEVDKREKEILCKRQDVLMGELENLLALVKQKEKQIADNDYSLKAVENKINNVVSGFKEIQSSIDVKYDKLQSVLAQVKLEAETLAPKKDEIDKFLIWEEEMGAKLRKFATISEEEAKGYRARVKLRRNLMSSLLKSREDKLTLANNEENLSEELKLFKQEVSAARAALQELSSRKSSIQQDKASFKQRIIFINKRVPELEAEKKVATAARNFKEAARIASETKSLCVEKEGIQIDMDAATSNLEKLEDEIEGTVNKLQEIEGVIFVKEKELAMARYQKLLWTAATAKAEKAAALEMGDVEEANLLLAEAEAADCEAEKLQSTYNFKEEDVTNLRKGFISVDLLSFLDQKQLEELAAQHHLFS